MSPHLQYEIVRARQQEIAARTVHAHHPRETHGTAGPRRRAVQRLSRAVAALSVCLAVSIAATAVGAQPNPSSVKHGSRISAPQYATEIHALEAKGYVPTSCTTGGTLMRNARTGRYVTIKL
jgi:hypothetical protein